MVGARKTCEKVNETQDGARARAAAASLGGNMNVAFTHQSFTEDLLSEDGETAERITSAGDETRNISNKTSHSGVTQVVELVPSIPTRNSLSSQVIV